ncbi:MAG: phosphoribosylanthranilate isomerase [Clostridia bacterium]|nr:phosphoribosylanthranilate isomerase [Clostridia bacterium]
MAKVKICGLRFTQDAEYVNEAKPDFAGFILSEGFRRSIDLNTAITLREIIDKSINTVGVFVNEDISNILNAIESGAVGVIQLHGSEDNDYIDNLKKHTDKTIIKAFTIKSPDDIEKAKKCHADFVLLDSGTGTGKEFDQSLIGEFPREYFLAGGMNPDNVKQRINELKPYAVDVSSGVETDGIKDREKVIRFVREARRNH